MNKNVEGPMSYNRQERRPATEAYNTHGKDTTKSHYKEPDKNKAKVESKPDKSCHEGKNVFAPAKKNPLPGQMYMPKAIHNEQDFAGEKKQKEMY